MKVLLAYEPMPSHVEALRRAAPGVILCVARDESSARELIADADGFMGNRFFLQSLPHARRLRWMQSSSMGIDLVLSGGRLLRDVTVTCVRGVYDDEIAEHALALTLALGRGLHLARDRQREGRWVRSSLRTLVGARALVLGWGGVGRGLARRLAQLGAEVRGVRRRHAGPPMRDDTGFVVHGPASWRETLPSTDLLVLALPLTRETRCLVDAVVLAALPTHAFLVNVGRGGTLDEVALVDALRHERLAGAALDVVAEEPPPATSPVWTEPRLLLTPHVGRSIESPPRRWEPLFVENLRRFAAGEPPLNVVDVDAGY